MRKAILLLSILALAALLVVGCSPSVQDTTDTLAGSAIEQDVTDAINEELPDIAEFNEIGEMI